jgi:hypothetical protein
VVVFLTTAALVACSGDGGGGSPTGPEPQSVFALGGQVSMERENATLEVTALLDGTEIARSFSRTSEGETTAVLNGTRVGIEPGSHVLELHFERVVPAPAEVAIIVGGVYVPPNGSEGVVLQDLGRMEEVREGDRVRFDFEI